MGMGEYEYYVYIVASRSRTLYIGFTSELYVRVLKHRNGTYEGFSKTYKCDRLVYFERFPFPEEAITREKQLKRWSREKKLALILKQNPAWADLSESWGKPVSVERQGM